MTREEYIQARNNNQIPMDLVYDYWIMMKKEGYENIDHATFERVFGQYMQMSMTPPSSIIDKVCGYYDKKYVATKVIVDDKIVKWV